MIDVEDDDAEMNAAIAKSRATVDKFITALNNPTPTQEGFSVKLLVEDDNGDGEHMWISPVKLEGNNFVGILNNEPRDLTNVKFGDELTVAKDEISDWMYMDDGLTVGGYSIRLLIERAPPEQREEMSKMMKFADE